MAPRNLLDHREDTGAVVGGRSKHKRDHQQSLQRAAVPPEEAAQQAHREQRRATAATERNTDQTCARIDRWLSTALLMRAVRRVAAAV